jgi:GTPase Era involved in 16S rRNA processing
LSRSLQDNTEYDGCLLGFLSRPITHCSDRKNRQWSVLSTDIFLRRASFLLSSGKSATGNSLLHSRSAFISRQAACSITEKCQKETRPCADISGRQKQIIVVDTPGFFDPKPTTTNQMVETTIASQIFDMTSPGVHAFLIVLRIGRFSPEEKQTVDFIKRIFGTDAAKYCILVFTREDQLDPEQTLDQFISDSSDLQELVRMCGYRKIGINNTSTGQPLVNKTNQLLQMIDQMVAGNNGTYYTNAQYQKIEKERAEAEKKRKDDELARIQKEKDELIAKVCTLVHCATG